MADKPTIEIVELSKAVGKKLSHVVMAACHTRILLVFEDGTVSQLSIEKGWDPSDVEICDDSELSTPHYSRSQLIDAGVIDAEG